MGFDNEFAHASQTDYLVFDIETVPMPECATYLDMDGIEAPSNYKDPEKIKAFIAEKRQRLIDSAGLDIDLCEIACIGWELPDGTGAVMPRAMFTEDAMLRAFWKAAQTAVLVGFNVWHFDLPVLARRSLYLGVSVPDLDLDSYRPGFRVRDVAVALSFGRRDLVRSLDFYCKRFGIAHDDSVKGADIAALVAAGKWEQVTGHCYADVHSTHLLAERIGLVRRPVPVEAVL